MFSPGHRHGHLSGFTEPFGSAPTGKEMFGGNKDGRIENQSNPPSRCPLHDFIYFMPHQRRAQPLPSLFARMCICLCV